MHEQRSPEKSEVFARLDGAVLGLLPSHRQQPPWSAAERPSHDGVLAALARPLRSNLALVAASIAAAWFERIVSP